MGTLNGCIEDSVRMDTTGTFGVSRENDNERRVVDSCGEKGLYVDITYYNKNLYK